MRKFQRFVVPSHAIIALLIGLFLVGPALVSAATIFGTGVLLQPGDVTSSHILNGTVVDADVSATAAISGTKVAPGGAGGTVVLSGGTRLATSSNLTYATSTDTLNITGNIAVSATTSFNGVAYKFPSSDGTSGHKLQTNGAGQLSWVAGSNSVVSGTYTAGETIGVGQAVAIATTTSTTRQTNDANTNGTALTTTTWIAQSTTTPASGVSAITGAFFVYKNCGCGAQSHTFEIQLQSDNSNSPSGTVLASSSVTAINANATNDTYSVTFPSPVNVSAGTRYWFVIYQTSVNSNGFLDRGTGTGESNARVSNNSGGSWSDAGYVAFYGWTFTDFVAGRAYLASASARGFRYDGFVGISQTTATVGQTITVDMLGLSTATTTFSQNIVYYLSNTQGALGTAAGTNSLKVGVGQGSNGILLRPDNP